MRIRTWSILVMTVFAAALVTVAASLVIIGQRVDNLNRQEAIAGDVVRGASELSYLADDYLLYQEGPQAKRWQASFAEFTADLSSLRPSTPEEVDLHNSIQAASRRMKAAFDDVVYATEVGQRASGAPLDPGLLQVSWSRLEAQSQEILSDSSRLSDLMLRDEDRLNTAHDVLVLVLVSTFGAFLIVYFFLVYRRALGAISVLQAGTRRIGAGDLGWRVPDKGRDEIGELSRAFNQMAADLNRVTASRAELEKEVAERKRAEEALRESEAKARALVEYAPTGIYEIDYRGPTFLSVNDAMCRILGYTQEELLALNPFALLDKESRERFAQRIKQQLAGQPIDESVEYRVKRKDGGETWAVLHVTLGYREGEPHTALVVAHDVTERKRAEEALRESKEKFEALVETTSDFIWETDSQGRYTYCSPRMEKLWGFKPEEMLGKTPFDLMPAEDRGQAQSFFADLAKAPMPFSMDSVSYNKQGDRVTLEIRGVPFFGSDGRLMGFRGVSRDITERKRAEATLAEAHAEAERRAGELESLMDAVPAGVMIARDREAMHIYGNRAAHDILQVPLEESNISKSAPDPEQVRTYRPMRDGVPVPLEDLPMQLAAARGIAVRDWECDVVFDDGERRAVSINAVPLLDERGRPRGAIAAFTDVTERKRAEETLRFQASILAQTGDAVVAIDDQYMITYWNHAAERLYGVKAEDALGHLLEEAYRFDWLAPEQAYESFSALESTGAWHGETIHTTNDGRKLHVESTVSVLMDSAGQQTGLLSVVRDVTERKHAEEAIRLQADMLSQTGDAIVAIDNSYHVIYWNRAAEQLYGVPAAEAVGRAVHEVYRFDWLAPEHAPAAFEALEQAGIWHGENVQTARDGRRFYVESSITLLKDASGQQTGLLAVVRDITARKRAEEALRESEERFRLLAEHSRDIIFERRTVPPYDYIYVSPANTAILGYTPEEYYADPDLGLKLLHPDDKERVLRVRQDPGTQPDPIEARYRHKDGHWVWTEIRAWPVRDAQGRQFAVAGITRDVTARKLAEAALAQERERLRVISDNTRMHLALLDREFRFVMANSTYCARTGYRAEDLIGKDHFTLFPSAENEVIFRHVRDTGEAIEFHDKPFAYPDNPEEMTYWDWTLAPVRDESGAVAGLVLSLFETTDRVRTEQALRESERRFRELAENSPDMVVRFLFAPEPHYEYVSPAAERLTGYTPAEFYADPTLPFKYTHPDDRTPVETARRAPDKLTGPIEMRLNRKDGSQTWAEAMYWPVYGPDGKVVGFEGIGRDITERKRREAEEERLRAEIQAILGHELRTPLTTIKGAAAMALKGGTPPTPEEVAELFGIIDVQADQLRNLVSDLTDAARIESGRFAVTVQPTGLGEVVEEARLAFARVFPNPVHVVMPPDLPRVSADRRRLLQVLGNLLNNAAKYSPAGSPVTLELSQDDDEVTVRVKDQGRGLAPEEMPLLFKKFSRLNPGAEGGVSQGLGLFISKGIVEAHSGRIWAESPGRDQGSTFAFTLPCHVEADAPVPPPVEAPPPKRPGPPAATGAPREETVSPAGGAAAHVVAADDDAMLLKTLQACLVDAGFRVTAVSDPLRVADVVQKAQPDLVLLDLVMPDVSGFEILTEIRRTSGVPVIILSGRDEESDMVKALSAGADDYVVKPFSPSELAARVQAVLRRRGEPARELARPPFILGDLSVDFDARQVTVAGRLIALSATEFKLLEELAHHAGRTVTYDHLLRDVWGPEYMGQQQLVRSFIRNLRHKLGDDAQMPKYILTERQVGYRVPRPQQDAA